MSDQPNWTPWPWALEIRAGSGTAADCTIAMIEQADERAPYRGMIARLQSAEHIDGIAKDEMVANAHLIAAAPDLYAALEMAKLWLDVDGRFDMQGINAALAKARGASVPPTPSAESASAARGEEG